MRLISTSSGAWAALYAYPVEALVALCDSVQADEADARRGPCPLAFN